MDYTNNLWLGAMLFNSNKPLPLNSIGLYFYLTGNLLFFLGEMKKNNIPNMHALVIILSLIATSFVLFRLTL